MKKQTTPPFSLLQHFKAVPLVTTALVSSALVIPSGVLANSLQDQIDNLQAQNAQTQGQLNSLQAQAANYQDAINRLQAQIASVQADIQANQARQAELQAQIAEAQRKLAEQKRLLSEDLKAMYVSGQMTTTEKLASSKNLGAFINAETYSRAVQTKIQNTLSQIKKLQAELNDQEAQVERLIADQQRQSTDLAKAQADQARLLAMNQSDQDKFNQQIKDTKDQIANLRALQLEANRGLGGRVVPGDPGHGGYPAAWDSPTLQDSISDSWGMLNRECVSYAAWEVYQAYGYMPYWGGVGNANQWPANARAAGIPTGSTPKVGSVAISLSGAYGHAMWVMAVSGNMIYVSQYNYDLQGHYSEMWVDGSRFTYIYFGH